MRKIIMAVALAAASLALPACSAFGIPESPQAAADATVLDEQAMLAVELAYKAARIAVETGVDAGLIKGAAAARFAVLDAKAFAAVTSARLAYKAGNASGYLEALGDARLAVTQLLALAGK